MKSPNIFTIIILSALISCRENKHTAAANANGVATQNSESHTSNQSAQTDTPRVTIIDTGDEKRKDQSDSLMAFIISFYSIGEGIDRGQQEKLMEYLSSYEKKSGRKIEFSQVHWGREGETDFCFPLKGFSDEQVTDFIKGAKQALNAAVHVHFLQNQPCRKGR